MSRNRGLDSHARRLRWISVWCWSRGVVMPKAGFQTMITRDVGVQAALSRDELEPGGGEGGHAKQQPAVAPALDVGFAVGAGLVADGQVDDPQVELGRAEEEVEIAEGIKIPKVIAVGGDGLVILFEKDLGAAEGVLEGLAEKPGEGGAEKLVGDHVEEPHGLLFHRVDQAHSV